MKNSQIVSTGFSSLDDVIQYLRMGDNVVFQVRAIEVYKRFVKAFVDRNIENAKKIIYIRFTQQEPLINNTDGIEIFSVNANNGFEEFCSQIHEKIALEGRDVFYIFDCLSELLDRWATDSMIGNFFKVTCPYLYELNTIAYFATIKNHNSYHSTAVIRDTTQVLFDIFEINAKTYVHPLKVWNRYSPTLFLPHVMHPNQLIPITSSGEVAALYSDLGEDDENPERDLDYWDRLFIKASELLSSSFSTSAKVKELIHQLSGIFLTRDERILELIYEHFSLNDILSIKSRLIGSGFIGGKAVGMLLARKILTQSSETWKSILEPHDSFYIGSDVYYSFLVDNDLWKLKMEQRRTSEQYFEKASYLRDRILVGKFNDTIKNKFLRMLEYFGQSPIIVRSSSLLEDGFGNAFPGKYESVFCINQGTLYERYHLFTEAVRKVFASTLSEEALAYREKRGLTHTEEQMALLVQRVSGSIKQDYFFPDLAGVAFSYNTYVWDSQMNPNAGMIRLVLGLGTRAVDRLEGDYARIAALDRPKSMPYDGLRSFKAYSQQKMDVLNIRHNCQECLPIQNLMDQQIDLHQTRIAERDLETEQKIKQLGLSRKESWVFSFNPLLDTDFTSTFSKLLKILETAYSHPVDIEFTLNFKSHGKYLINLLQCRPLQVQGFKDRVDFPQEMPLDQILFKSKGHFMGGNISTKIHKVILVEPHAYNLLSQSEKYEVARIVGRLNKQIHKETTTVLLLGPGRWGSKIPSLGVPAAFAELNHTSILAEIGYHHTGFLPDVSFGTHFFQDMIESEMFYLALFPEKEDTVYQLDLLDDFAQKSFDLVPEKSNLREAVKVYDLEPGQKGLQLISDITTQNIQCIFY